MQLYSLLLGNDVALRGDVFLIFGAECVLAVRVELQGDCAKPVRGAVVEVGDEARADGVVRPLRQMCQVHVACVIGLLEGEESRSEG